MSATRQGPPAAVPVGTAQGPVSPYTFFNCVPESFFVFFSFAFAFTGVVGAPSMDLLRLGVAVGW